jgi:mannan endo-1,4-beta-mannosidase
MRDRSTHEAFSMFKPSLHLALASAVLALASGCSDASSGEGSGGAAGTGGVNTSGGASGTAGGSGANACSAGLTRCGTTCLDLANDPQNCGACGTPCGAGLFCSLGACASSCAAGLTQCGASCADLTSSAAHCGACNVVCSAGQTCSAGACLGGTAGSGGTAGTGGTAAGASGSSTGGSAGSAGGTAPPGMPGVVVAIDDMGTLGCVPLCTMETHPDDPDTTDDWAYEGWSCILPFSPTGTRNQSCTTGEPLPPIDRDGLPGIVVDSGGDGTLDCIPLCAEGAMPSSPDPENPSSLDWGWEYQATCIIRESNTAKCNQTCITAQPLPDPALVTREGVLIDEACVALCECPVTGEDPNWGWEYQTGCVLAGSEPASMGLACTTNEPEVLTPPPLSGATMADGFYVQDGRLYDAYGVEFVMRGVNNPHIWFDTGNRYLAYQALDAIAGYGTNTIRVVWETTGGSPALLSRILYRIVELDMVPMIELHDVTGGTTNAELLRMAQYYTGAEVRQVLLDYRAYLLINIANEWSGNDFQNGYAAAITELRNAGLTHTLVIDANGYGQNASSIFGSAEALMNADPEGNLLFSVHMYNQFGQNSQVDSVLDQAVSSGVPLIVGEFGPQLQGGNVAWQQIMAKCQQHRLGYLAWSWSGNDASTANLNIVNDFTTQLTPSWGRQVMVENANSIQQTAQKASIFQ